MDLSAHDRELERGFHTHSLHRHRHRLAARAPQCVDRIFLLPPGRRTSIDGRDQVQGPQIETRGGTVWQNIEYDNAIAVRQDPHSHAAVIVGQQGTALLIGLNECGVGITNFPKEPADRHLVELVAVHGFHEIAGHIRPHDLEQPSAERRRYS
jgi:hypothetical protein